jgi:hypothetical protein
MIQKIIFLILFLILSITNIFSFSQITNPTNNSLVTDLNQTISVIISGTENVSTFIDWNNSLVGYWNFNSGNTTHVFDLSQNNNHGEYLGGTINNNSNQIRGNYTQYDGIDDYVDLGSPTELDNILFDYTICAWINPSSYGEDGFGRIFSKRITGVAGIELMINNNSGIEELRLTHLGGTNAFIPNVISLNSWQFVCAIHDDSLDFGKMYHSGINISGELPMGNIVAHASASATIGKRSSDSLRYFDGLIDELVIFKRVLDDSEINALYNSQINNFQYNTTNLQNNTQYNYTIYSINTTGDLIQEPYNFFTNTSYIQTIFNNQDTSLFPNYTFMSFLFLLSLLFLFFRK